MTDLEEMRERADRRITDCDTRNLFIGILDILIEQEQAASQPADITTELTDETPRETIERLYSSLEASNARVDSLYAELDAAKRLANAWEANYDKSLCERAKLKTELEAANERIEYLKTKLNRADADIPVLKHRAERAEDQNERLKSEIGRANARIAELEAELARLRAVVAKLGDVEMVVPVEWKRRGFKHGLWVRDHLIEQALYAPGVTSAIEDSYGVIRLREAGEGCK